MKEWKAELVSDAHIWVLALRFALPVESCLLRETSVSVNRYRLPESLGCLAGCVQKLPSRSRVKKFAHRLAGTPTVQKFWIPHQAQNLSST